MAPLFWRMVQQRGARIVETGLQTPASHYSRISIGNMPALAPFRHPRVYSEK